MYVKAIFFCFIALPCNLGKLTFSIPQHGLGDHSDYVSFANRFFSHGIWHAMLHLFQFQRDTLPLAEFLQMLLV